MFLRFCCNVTKFPKNKIIIIFFSKKMGVAKRVAPTIKTAETFLFLTLRVL